MSGAGFQCRDVFKTYGATLALSDVAFSIVAGQHTAILGPSGCGKSTLLRILAGLEPPAAGQVLLDGVVVSGPGRIVVPAFRRGVSMVFQDLALWLNLSGFDNVLLGLSGRKLPRHEARQRAGAALALCGVEALARRRPGEMSGGEQQRIALARAIAGEPAWLLLDEPFSGLDLDLKNTLLTEIRGLAAVRRLTIVLVAHDPFEVRALCRHAVVLEKGQVCENGALDQLLEQPKTCLLKAFCEWGRKREP